MRLKFCCPRCGSADVRHSRKIVECRNCKRYGPYSHFTPGGIVGVYDDRQARKEGHPMHDRTQRLSDEHD